MKVRKRLSPEEAEKLGFKPKPNDKDGRFARYTIDESVGAKILVFDIETSPLRGYFWSLWKQNISTNQILSDWFMLTWSAKWLFSEEVLSDKLTRDEVLEQDDSRITKSIFDLIDEADITISHNGDKFDIRRLNTRFIYHKLGTPSSYQNIDTLKHARKQLSISSNKLDYLGEFFGLGRKIDTGGFNLWNRCMMGDSNALREMQEYCDQDVKLLEDVYLHLRPFIKPHPNLGLHISDDIHRCPTCASDQLVPTGDYYTTVSIYTEFKCTSCGANCRSRKANKKAKGIMSSLPK